MVRLLRHRQTDRQTDRHDEAIRNFSKRASVTAANEVIKQAEKAKVITSALHKHCIKHSADILFLVISVFLLLSKFKGLKIYEGWNFNSGNYLFTTDTT